VLYMHRVVKTVYSIHVEAGIKLAKTANTHFFFSTELSMR